MANRTFKVYGQAYAPSGSVTVAITVDGTQVYNSTVPTSATPRDGQPTTQVEMLSFVMDESVVGDKSLQIDVSGGEFVMGNWWCNGASNNYLPLNWATTNAPDMTNISAAAQSEFADIVGESALGSELYNALKAGSLTNPSAEQAAAMAAADQSGPLNLTQFVLLNGANDKKASAQVNGVDVPGWDDAETSAKNWLILQDGDSYTATWSITPTDNFDNNYVPAV